MLESLSYHLTEKVSDNLKWLQNHNELCDVLLISGNNQVHAHSCVLASNSPVLAAILQARLVAQNDWSILKPLIISLDEADKNSNSCAATTTTGVAETSILDLLVSFLYGEHITIEQKRIQELLSFSKLLGLSQHFIDTSMNEASGNAKPLSIKKKSNRKRIEPSPIPSSDGKDIPSVTDTESEKDEKLLTNTTLLINETQANKTIDLEEKKVFKHKTLERNKKVKVKNKRLNKTKVSDISRSSAMPLIDKESISIERDECQPESINTPDTYPSILVQEDNLTDTESWFKNELLNSIQIKTINKCNDFPSDTIELVKQDDRNITEMETKSDFPQLECSKNQLKRTTRTGTSCSMCKSSFHRASDLIKHVKEEDHYSENCPLCFLQLTEYVDQKDHFLQHDHPLPFFCFCCDSRFRSRAGLSMHAPKHSNMKPYTCKECGRGFKWRHSAQAHSITHKNHCHLLCDICGFSSKYMSTFKSHLKRHYDQFFPCPHPGCTFKSFRKAQLNDHYATHAKLRPHQCEVCGYSFSLAKNLWRHMRLHTPDTGFLKCALYSHQNCPFKTTRPDKLRFHLIQKHNLEHHDKISMPAMTQKISLSTMQSKKEFEFSDEGKGNKNSSLEESLPAEHARENKSMETNILSSHITNMLEDQSTSSDGRLNSLLIPDSFETYILPAPRNPAITEETIVYNNQLLEADSALVLMGNIQVLNSLPADENNSSEAQEIPFSQHKADASNDIITNLPVILQTNKNASYVHDSRATSPVDTFNDPHGAGVDAFNAPPCSGIDAFNTVSSGSGVNAFDAAPDTNLAIADTERNIDIIKLQDGFIGFLPQVEDPSIESSSSINWSYAHYVDE